jgi:hypothetical protein
MKKAFSIFFTLLLLTCGVLAQTQNINMTRSYTACMPPNTLSPVPVLAGGYVYPGCAGTTYTYYYGHLNTAQQFWACVDTAQMEHSIRTKFCTCWDDYTDKSVVAGQKQGSVCTLTASAVATVSDCDY